MTRSYEAKVVVYWHVKVNKKVKNTRCTFASAGWLAETREKILTAAIQSTKGGN